MDRNRINWVRSLRRNEGKCEENCFHDWWINWVLLDLGPISCDPIYISTSYFVNINYQALTHSKIQRPIKFDAWVSKLILTAIQSSLINTKAHHSLLVEKVEPIVSDKMLILPKTRQRLPPPPTTQFLHQPATDGYWWAAAYRHYHPQTQHKLFLVSGTYRACSPLVANITPAQHSPPPHTKSIFFGGRQMSKVIATVCCHATA